MGRTYKVIKFNKTVLFHFCLFLTIYLCNRFKINYCRFIFLPTNAILIRISVMDFRDPLLKSSTKASAPYNVFCNIINRL